ncbi:MAG: amidohydrolase [Actinomycetaceae bacterium]|nr:amidohydrolase [Arcanobacterium sp.]MDD7504631.1 amidohydrolase [Actinomycetaceae bacterium]MDY6143053.1 amidohydrolase [Arcanobacterium sp.]
MDAPNTAVHELDQRAHDTAQDMIAWRHYLHQHPELSNREENTAAFIAEKLRSFGIDDVRTGIAGHGVIGVLRGEQSGAGTALLRADIDALPVSDESGVDFASTVRDTTYPGGPFPVSHACGHDCHTAMLLGAMRILSEQRGNLPGNVIAVFQPAEEGAPAGETGGARAMIESGALDEFSPTMAFGMHVQPFPKGVVTVMPGTQFGASCMVKITVTGKQVHGSTPWEGIDPMPAVGQILTGIGQIYRQTNAFSPFTVSIGHIDDVGRFNVIGRSVTCWGTIRSLSDAVMAQVQERLRSLVAGNAAAYGCQAEVEFLQPVPAVHNTKEWVDALTPSFAAIVGESNIVTPPPSLGYDDVSEFVNRYGGLYVGLGVQDTELVDGELISTPGGRGFVSNHHPAFYADDETLVTGVRLHARVAYDHLTSLAQ